MSFLALAAISKSFGPNQVVKDFNLSVGKGEFVSFLGPSGCGKTTVLRMVAGFETPSAGTIRIDGQDVTRLPANKRRIGMVFQAYALFPNMSVSQNVAFGLKVAGADRATISRRVGEMLELIKLDHLGERFPYQLSGGQQQRVALARALAPKPNLLLLDEPLSALDAQIRVSLRDDIRAIQRELGITTIFVTHDQEEALSISDRVVVMHQGRADQLGTPAEIYNRPATRFVANFVGKLNTFEARIADADEGQLNFAGKDFTAPTPLRGLRSGDPITVALRPEALALHRRHDDEASLQGKVLDFNFLGSVIRAKVEVDGRPICLDMFNQSGFTMPPVGTATELYFSRSDLLVLPE
ncbi:ABC transporter ATP-binding protein [Jiella sp. MQZ9-1]|uniref:ABC transporter ATP-binding protein n=1 Tax=Jiella flava TaxID=2816857 RepID=A0A939FZM2_9HYPH|nr:ABC transporter ATP-binding protein [Jiella flava]MBO0662447.1 ABC transporter ATP-binding protein [Jiella flava]MCD2471672.1 ABC transporter ATP-binding protein [Jiella flava]